MSTFSKLLKSVIVALFRPGATKRSETLETGDDFGPEQKLFYGPYRNFAIDINEVFKKLIFRAIAIWGISKICSHFLIFGLIHFKFASDIMKLIVVSYPRVSGGL